MRTLSLRHVAFALAAIAIFAAPSQAAVPVMFGTSWDPPEESLQSIVDARYGPGAINVQTDFIGAKSGELDPWFWVANQLSALIVREIAGNSNRNVLGWYEETGTRPIIDGVADGIIFDGPAGEGAVSLVTFDHPMTKFGFYLDPNGPEDAVWAPQPEKFWTNRFYNDKGPNGTAVHVPFDGDVQAIVFDVSRFTQPNTYLVCFEDLDSGCNPQPCCYPTDNDYNDFVFEVTAFGATPTIPMSLGALKVKYLK